MSLIIPVKSTWSPPPPQYPPTLRLPGVTLFLRVILHNHSLMLHSKKSRRYPHAISHLENLSVGVNQHSLHCEISFRVLDVNRSRCTAWFIYLFTWLWSCRCFLADVTSFSVSLIISMHLSMQTLHTLDIAFFFSSDPPLSGISHWRGANEWKTIGVIRFRLTNALIQLDAQRVEEIPRGRSREM